MTDKIEFFNELAFVNNTDTEAVVVTFSIDDTNGLTLRGPNTVGPALLPPPYNDPNFNVEGTMRVNGDLIIVGDTVTTNVVTLAVEDKNILMNVPNPVTNPVSSPEGAGTIVIRDEDDGATPQAGILWSESLTAWDLNYGIAQDIYSDDVLPPTQLPSNPRLMNLGDPVDPQDAATRAWVLTQSLGAATDLGDLADVTITGASNGDVLRFTTVGNIWENSEIGIGDIENVTPPSADGYMFADYNAGNPLYSFVTGIDVSDVTGLATVATTGDYSDLINTPTPPGNYDIQIISDTTSPGFTSYVSTVDIANGIVIGATSQIVLQAGASEGNIYLQPDETVGNSAIIIKPQDPLVPGAVTVSGKIESEIGLELTSASGNVVLQGLLWPNVDGTIGQTLVTDGVGTLSWADSGSGLSYRIENSNAATYVDTQITDDVVTVITPALGASSVAGGTISDTTGISLDPGTDRYINIVGTGTSVIAADTSVNITAGDSVIIDATANVIIQDYVLPNASATRTWGDALIVDPNEFTNPAQDILSWTTIDLDFLADTNINVGAELNGEVLTYNGTNWINAFLDYSKLTGTPTVVNDLVDLDDTNSTAVSSGYLRWNISANEVIYESQIPGSVINLVGTITDIQPAIDDTNLIGSASFRFAELFTVKMNNLVYPDTDGTAGQVMATDGLGNLSFVSIDGIGDVFLSVDQTFTGSNSFIPSASLGTFIVTTDAGDIDLSSTTGNVNIQGLSYPDIDGTPGQVLATNGLGSLAWATGPTGSMQAVTFPFTQVDAGTFNIGTLLPDNSVVVTARIFITSAFNAGTPVLELGSDQFGNSDTIATTADSDLLSTGLNLVNNYFDVSTTDQQLMGTLTLNGATTGAGNILIEYYIA